MNKLFIRLMVLFLPFGTTAQDQVAKVLSDIQSNNPALKAYQKLNDAQKLDNKTGIYLKNPDVEFNYLWSDPSSMGTRKDLVISQSFDFPTAYGLKKQIADVKNNQADLEFELHKKTVLFEAKRLCNELIYLNATQVELEKRLRHAENIALAYETKFEKGETNIIENNKARLNLLIAQKELEENVTERESILLKLAGLNGGKMIDFTQFQFPAIELPDNFDEWFDENERNNATIQHALNEIGITEKQVKLTKALNMPKLSTGYMSESVVGESFQGVTLGVSIPLWENKNRVKLATVRQLVAKEMAEDTKNKSYNRLKAKYEKAKRLKETLNGYKTALETLNASELLKKALDAGELSLIDYMLELSLYYETTDKILSVENEFNQKVTELFFYNL